MKIIQHTQKVSPVKYNLVNLFSFQINILFFNVDSLLNNQHQF